MRAGAQSNTEQKQEKSDAGLSRGQHHRGLFNWTLVEVSKHIRKNTWNK